MKKTEKTASIRQPHNYWISRRVWADDNGNEYVKINGNFVSVEWILLHGWEIDIVW